MNLLVKSTGALTGVLITGLAIAAYKSTVGFQMGYPGVGMEVVNTKEEVAARAEANVIPPALPPSGEGGQLAVDAYKNVQVLGHLPAGEVTRLMTAMTLWVAPDNGCGYCHAPTRDAKGVIQNDDNGNPLADPNNMHSDEVYAKRVARRMLQMTMRINGDWKEHVKATGVTCYTCHRGNPVPTNIWFDEPDGATRFQGIQNPPRNAPAMLAGVTSLPHGALRPFLAGDARIRIQSTEAMGSLDRSSIKQTEWTYALMIHMSNSLGVNCGFCHNSRSFGDWTASPAKRETAWQGIRMVRELNGQYLEPLASILPPGRHGPLGDGPKVSCATCHQGAYKPLLGFSMLGDYPSLAEAKTQPQKTAVAPTEPVSSDAGFPLGDAAFASDGSSPPDAGLAKDAAPTAASGGAAATATNDAAAGPAKNPTTVTPDAAPSTKPTPAHP